MTLTKPLRIRRAVPHLSPWTERLRRVWPEAEDRPEQAKCAKAIAQAIAKREQLLIEAPAGTGKSISYLVPAIDAIKKDSTLRVIISTASKTLQDQLMEKDILQACGIAGQVSYAVLKGRNNYYCPERADEASFRDPAFTRALNAVRHGSIVDLDRYPDLPEPVRAAVCGDDYACDQCKLCPYGIARTQAQQSSIAVVNHHLLVLSISRERLLGSYEILVIDEAHELADDARGVLGFKVGPREFNGLAAVVEKRLKDYGLAGKLRQWGEHVSSAARDTARSSKFSVRIRGPVNLGVNPSSLSDVAERCTKEGMQGCADKATELLNRIEVISTGAKLDRYAYWPAQSKPGRPWYFEAQLLDVAPVLSALHHDRKQGPRAIIATSATLDCDDDMKYVRSDTGLSDARIMTVDSPFDFAECARWIIPSDITVEPNDSGFPDQTIRAVVEVARAARGRMLGLFTSVRMMNKAAAAIRDQTPFPVLVQGEGRTRDLVQEFRASVGTVLIGTMSLWTGVDVPGEALSVLLFDRIPFSPPSDPLTDALMARVENGFQSVLLPRAVLRTRQGVGRLIRSKTDRGVWVCLDRRLLRTKGYGRDLRLVLPFIRRLDTYGDIQAFLDG